MTTSVGTPRLPTNIAVEISLRRAGWLTTFSASEVVNPAPVKAERAWKAATSGGVPVATSAPVTSRVNSREMVATVRNVATAIMRVPFRSPRGCHGDGGRLGWGLHRLALVPTDRPAPVGRGHGRGDRIDAPIAMFRRLSGRKDRFACRATDQGHRTEQSVRDEHHRHRSLLGIVRNPHRAPAVHLPCTVRPRRAAPPRRLPALLGQRDQRRSSMRRIRPLGHRRETGQLGDHGLDVLAGHPPVPRDGRHRDRTVAVPPHAAPRLR